MKHLYVIAAVAGNGVIGSGNDLPWKLPPDLRYFQRTTRGHAMIMGRRTFESIGSRPLPGRPLVVVSRTLRDVPAGVQVAGSVEEALALAVGEVVFSAGGTEIFRQSIPLAERLYLTRIERDFPGDTYFPEVDFSAWRLTQDERHPAGDEADFAYRFEVWERRAI